MMLAGGDSMPANTGLAGPLLAVDDHVEGNRSM